LHIGFAIKNISSDSKSAIPTIPQLNFTFSIFARHINSVIFYFQILNPDSKSAILSNNIFHHDWNILYFGHFFCFFCSVQWCLKFFLNNVIFIIQLLIFQKHINDKNYQYYFEIQFHVHKPFCYNLVTTYNIFLFFSKP